MITVLFCIFMIGVWALLMYLVRNDPDFVMARAFVTIALLGIFLVVGVLIPCVPNDPVVLTPSRIDKINDIILAWVDNEEKYESNLARIYNAPDDDILLVRKDYSNLMGFTVKRDVEFDLRKEDVPQLSEIALKEHSYHKER